jgi:type I restriction enzyme S subunit
MLNKRDIQEQFDPIIAIINSDVITEGTFRLDGQYYALFENNIVNLRADSFLKLEDCCLDIYEVPPFKHIYVNRGIPFYTSSALFDNEFTPSHMLIPDMPDIEKYIIKKGQILMARSGNVESGILGQLVMVGDIMNGTATSDHVIRFTANCDVINSGYLAAFLMSEVCKGQLLKNAAGAVIPAIRPDSLRDLQIPIVNSNLQEQIGYNMKNAVDRREQAIYYLKEARSLILSYNNLPPLLNIDSETIDPTKETQIRLTNLSEFTEEYRLDSHFYNPIAKAAFCNIKEYSKSYSTLKDLTEDIIIGKRFKRNYVESDHGTPFIGSKNILQIRPTELKYLSNSEIGFMDDLLLKKNMILIACSGSLGGTFGKAGFVYKNFEDYAASQHILRIVVNEAKIDPGYLYAFLSSNYGYQCVTRYRWGALIDEIDDDDMSKLIIPLPDEIQQKEIGNLVRKAYDLRAEAILLEDEAQCMLAQALTEE